MEKNAILAFVLSMAVFAAYFLLFSPQEPTHGPKATPDKVPSATKTSPPPSVPAAASKTPALSGSQADSTQPARTILVKAKEFEARFSETGGTIKSYKLTAYKEHWDGRDLKELIKTDQPSELPLQLEWIKKTLPDLSQARFTADKEEIVLSPSRPKDSLTFRWTSPQGLTLLKTFNFSYDSYRVDLIIQVTNRSSAPLDDNLALILKNRFVPSQDNASSFQGVLDFIGGQFKERPLSKIEKEEVLTGKIQWGAIADTYFMEGVIPLEDQQTVSMKVSKTDPELLKLVFVSAPLVLTPQSEKKISYALYFGPRDTKILEPLGMELDKAVNFGFFDIIAKPLLWVLRFFNGFFHNYGWSIILLTILIKIIFWPLTHKSYKSMKDMQKVQPKIAKLREKYKDNREKLNQETMALYKTYKVNPMGGCLPMIIQIPVFFALYSLLGYAIELRHAPFLLWINDLSAPDRLPIGMPIPYVGDGIPVLTLLMGASMFIQQKMTPTTGDPAQAKMMLFLPVIFTFMFINFAAGLVLYWLVNNVLSIGQQYYINKYAN
ncbi:MAG TPA: membrane protein insertase YidC [Thermodesulfobacteriota bacterium]|nr:membrane protein insertase YidC [Thermodesulfobacteriota bacterium]